MEYLKSVLGIHVIYHNSGVAPVTNYIHARYRLQEVSLDGMRAVFAYPKTELDSVNAIKKHFERIQKSVNAPTVLVPDRLTYRQREYLLREHIPFVVDGRQIYLPFMAIYLQERHDGEKAEIPDMLPSAQLLLLLYSYIDFQSLKTVRRSGTGKGKKTRCAEDYFFRQGTTGPF